MGRRRRFKHGGNESEVTIDKAKKYKWDSKGDFVEFTGTAGKNEITVSGSKSSLRRIADIERNIAILATTLTSSDDGADDGENSSFGKNVNQTTRFKKSVRLDSGANLKDEMDMNDNKITEVATATADTDAANKKYVDDAITALIGGAPGALDTLNELAEAINDDDDENTKNSKYILNGMRRDFYQRNFIINGLKESADNDLILISDLDEIPKLDNIDLHSTKDKFVFFKQKMFYYKFNLCSKSVTWIGTRGCKKKYLESPQWLRNIKDRSYPIWRLDIIFSKNKYSNINFIQDGGWHFSYIKTPEDIEKKLKSYAHHREYELNALGIQKIKNKIQNKESIYDLKTDMKNSKFKSGQKLIVSEMNELPTYIQNNLNKYKQWLE